MTDATTIDPKQPAPAPSPAPAPAPAPGPIPAPGPVPASDPVGTADKPVVAAPPAGFPAQFWDADKAAPKLDDLTREFTRLAQSEAERAARAATLPAKADDYKQELPQDFQLPQGVTFQPYEANDPRLAAARELALDLKLDQAGFSKLVALDAKMKLARDDADRAWATAEKAKLGETGPARLQDMTAWLRVNLPAAQFDALGAALQSAAAVEGIESLIKRANGGSIPIRSTGLPANTPQEKSVAERMYPHLPSGLPPASARSA